MTHDIVNDRLARIAEFVRARLYRKAVEAQALNPEQVNDADYRWYHTLRVANYGKVIAEGEGADIELVVVACLLHDMAVFDPGSGRDHGRIAAELSRPILESVGYTPEQVENICYSIASHVDVKDPVTIEARVVTDADNVDRFGAYRAYLYVQAHRGDYQQLIPALISRIDRLKEYLQSAKVLETATGSAMFREQVSYQIQLLEAIVRESDWAVVPGM